MNKTRVLSSGVGSIDLRAGCIPFVAPKRCVSVRPLIADTVRKSAFRLRTPHSGHQPSERHRAAHHVHPVPAAGAVGPETHATCAAVAVSDAATHVRPIEEFARLSFWVVGVKKKKKDSRRQPFRTGDGWPFGQPYPGTKTIELAVSNDNTWQQICTHLGWRFVPTV